MPALPDLLQFHCANTDSDNCPVCPRDFIIPINAIEGIFRNDDDHAIILIKGIHYCPNPECVNRLRFITTSINWDAVVAAVGGRVQNMGEVALTHQSNLPRG